MIGFTSDYCEWLEGDLEGESTSFFGLELSECCRFLEAHAQVWVRHDDCGVPVICSEMVVVVWWTGEVMVGQ